MSNPIKLNVFRSIEKERKEVHQIFARDDDKHLEKRRFETVVDTTRFQPKAVSAEVEMILDAETMSWHLDNVDNEMLYEKYVEAGKFLGSQALQQLIFDMETKEVIKHSGWSLNNMMDRLTDKPKVPFVKLSKDQKLNHRKNLTKIGFSVSSHLYEGVEMHSVLFRLNESTGVSFTRIMEEGDFLSSKIAKKIAEANSWLVKEHAKASPASHFPDPNWGRGA